MTSLKSGYKNYTEVCPMGMNDSKRSEAIQDGTASKA